MKKLLASTAAFGFALSLPLGAALAQGADVKIDDAVNAAAGAAGAVTANFDSVITAMGNTQSETTELQGLAQVGSVNVIRISTLEGNDATVLSDTMAKGQADIDALHAALAANASLKSQLDAQSIAIDDVVAIDVKADGAVDVFVQG